MHRLGLEYHKPEIISRKRAEAKKNAFSDSDENRLNSIERVPTKLWQIMLTSRQVADAAPFATVAITGGVLAAEALALFQK